MNKAFNFLGLGFQLGQEQRGLSKSHEFVRSYLSVLERSGLKIHDRGEVTSSQNEGLKLRTHKQIDKVDWRPYQKAYSKIKSLLRKDRTLLNWGGDHSVAMSTVGAFCSEHDDGYVVWIDAHADLNLPRYSPTGNLHGMPVSVLLNLQNIRSDYFPWIKNNLRADRLIYVGVRDLDPFEKNVIQGLGIKMFTSRDIREWGMWGIASHIFELTKNSPLHISFDIDSLSPEYAPSTGVPVADGLSLTDLNILGKVLSKHSRICSMDVVEINPELGSEVQVQQTYLAAFKFLMSIFNNQHGGAHDADVRANQTLYSTQMEQGSQIQS